MTREEFLIKLKNPTPQEINNIIKENGKKRKLYCPFVIEESNKKQSS